MLESRVQRKTVTRPYYEEPEWSVNFYLYFILVSVCFLLFLIHRLNKFHIFLFTQEFPGNSDASTVVKNELGTVTKARYVRFYALTYNAWPCFKVEIFGQKDRQK